MSAAHGTVSRYVRGLCRCDECTRANRIYNKRLRLSVQRGESRLVDVAVIVEYVAKMQAAGMSQRGIAIAAGYPSHSGLWSALNGRHVTQATAARILAVRPTGDTRPDAFVDATGTRRRLQALATIGYPYRVVAEELGVDESSTSRILSGATPMVRRRTAEAVAALYDRRWSKPGPSAASARRALARGWALPLAWDDDEIDDPTATPCLDSRTAGAQVSLEVMLEDFQHTRGQHGGNTRLAAERLGVTRDALERALHRARAAGIEVNFFHDRRTA